MVIAKLYGAVELAPMPHALIVDDNPVILMDAADMVEAAGFEVFTAYDADRALNILDDHSSDIHLLFTDVEMPSVIDGFALARHAAARWGHIRILVASGQCRPGPGDLPDGAVFVAKPFSAEVVHARLHEILEEDQKPEALKRMSPRP